jgi:NADH-quinone oxidoreductase subunit K
MFLAVSAILFTIGLIGVLLRRSPLTILLSLEIMLNSVNLTLVAFSRQVGGSDGQVFALVVMGIAAAEVVVGLGLVVAMTRRSMVLDTDELRTLNG